jgi:hypothetical protein
VPPSNASTNLTVPSPEGITTEKPELINQTTNGNNVNGNGNHRFLPLGQDPHCNLNESQARRSSTFHSNPPYTLQTYLDSEDPYHYTSITPNYNYEPRMNNFISQGTYFQAQQSSVVRDRSSRRSKQGTSGKSGQSSCVGGEMAGECGTGEGFRYPMDMSLSE